MALPGLSFASGLKIQGDVWCKFGSLISWPDLGPSSFALVVAFDRCKSRLTVDSVGSILQATVGDSASHFRVSFLHDHTFKFFVSLKPVGFFINMLGSFECDLYFISFYLCI
jgi:hypothetical protein